jgi:hypothetical protein
MPIAFKPKTKTVADPQPTQQALGTDQTTAAVQPFAGTVTRPTMFGKTATTVKPKLTLKPTAQQPFKPAAEAAAAGGGGGGAAAPAVDPMVALLQATGATAAATALELGAKTAVVADTAVDPRLKGLQSRIEAETTLLQYTEAKPTPYVPEDRMPFSRTIAARFPVFELPKATSNEIDPNACSTQTLQTYKYQAFVREYMRQESPYRGVLVYHGLGSGKTCTSIAAAEALYGAGKQKVIVMTPISLKENFLNEIMKCGFRHYRLKNVWQRFPLSSKATELFAEQVVGIPRALIDQIKRRDADKQVIWMPNLSRPDSEANYDELKPWEQSAIREQLYATIQNKITFIGYTGVSEAKLKDMAMTKPSPFDDAVVVIDEVHNLTRLMAGKLDAYLVPSKRAIYEPITTEPLDLKRKTVDQRYNRGYLFYRLLSQAKNCKIIALSGTPIVNQPVELGILGNMLHGYFQSFNAPMPNSPEAQRRLTEVLRTHPRVDFFELNKSFQTVFVTLFDEGILKKFDTDGNFVGVEYVGVAEAGLSTIQELFADLDAKLTPEGIRLGKPTFEAMPLLPPTTEEFNNNFVDPLNVSIKNGLVFGKRMSGLVSYYRGSKKDLMPEVVKDEVVDCPLSTFALPQYQAARMREIENAPKGGKKTVGQELQELEQKESASYRFRSRAACNFAFPKGIDRPFPGSDKEVEAEAEQAAELYGDGVTNLAEDEESVAAAEEAESARRAAEESDSNSNSGSSGSNSDSSGSNSGSSVSNSGSSGSNSNSEDEGAAGGGGGQRVALSYQQRLAKALERLRAMAPTVFKIDDAAPENEQLQTYSRKFYEMYKRIMASPGSSLVYSTFKTVEGLGVFSMALDTNGFAPIRLTGPDTDLDLAPESKQSLLRSPDQPRYIVYDGSASIRRRQVFINIFNMQLEKLPTKIAAFFKQAALKPLVDTANKQGQVCRVFMITGAGAEGLSLRNVRTVHIMEPYWNKVRTDQVKGRAVRICSHSDLPYSPDPAQNQRTVEIYTYLASFAPGAQIDRTIELNDGNITSDQHIQALANGKDKIATEFLSEIKRSAVDCLLNYQDNKENTTAVPCYTYTGTIQDFLYDPRLSEDIKKTTLLARGMAAATAAAGGGGGGAAATAAAGGGGGAAATAATAATTGLPARPRIRVGAKPAATAAAAAEAATAPGAAAAVTQVREYPTAKGKTYYGIIQADGRELLFKEKEGTGAAVGEVKLVDGKRKPGFFK